MFKIVDLGLAGDQEDYLAEYSNREKPNWETDRIDPHFKKPGYRISANAGDHFTAHLLQIQRGVVPAAKIMPREKPRTLRFNPLGDIPFFNPANYSSPGEYEKALNFLLVPFSPDMARVFNIRVQENLGLLGLCADSVSQIIPFLRKRRVQLAAELRTVDNQQSAVLVQYRNRFFVFDRAAANYELPPEMGLGWYAPLFTGRNHRTLPHFRRYEELYNAYRPDNFVLNQRDIRAQ